MSDRTSPASTGTGGPGGTPTNAVTFRERLYVPWYHWPLPLLAAGLLAAEVHMGYPGVRAWLPYVLLLPLTALLIWRFGSARVEVRGEELWAGDAHLPLRFIGEVRVVPVAAKRKALGPAFDPAAFALHRGWIGPMLWIEVTDPDDPTPYWMISTRSPDRLCAALATDR